MQRRAAAKKDGAAAVAAVMGLIGERPRAGMGSADGFEEQRRNANRRAAAQHSGPRRSGGRQGPGDRRGGLRQRDEHRPMAPVTPAAPSSFVASNRAARRIAAVQDSQLLHLLQSFLKSLQCAYNIHRHGTGEIQKHEEASGDHPKALNSVHDGAPHNHMAIFAVLREL